MVELDGARSAMPAPRPSAGSGRAPPWFWYAVGGCLLLVGLQLGTVVLAAPRSSQISTQLVLSGTEIVATVACLWTARRARRGDRRWRLLIGAMVGGSAAATAVTAVVLLRGRSIDESWSGYAVLLVFYALALAGLLCLPTDPVDSRSGHARWPWRGQVRWYLITTMDAVLIVGSVILLEWQISLDRLVGVGVTDPTTFRVALVHQVCVLILAAAVLLIATFRRPRSPAALALLGAGLLTHGLTINIIAYRIAQDRYDLPHWISVPFTAAFLLILLAVLVPTPVRTREETLTSPHPRALWAHAALPYAALGAAGLPIVAKLINSTALDRFEASVIVGLLVVALGRQMITLAENIQLLAKVREREDQLRYQAFHDPLTGLANRALFTRRLRRAVARSVDADDAPGRDEASIRQETTMSVLFVDLDHFKQVNDALGHAAGDELLKISAQRLRAGTRTADTVARLGGDEFAVILEGRGPDTPCRVAGRLASALQAPCDLAGRPYLPRASLGLVTLDHATRPVNPDILLHQADLAMYTAKHGREGKLVVHRFDPPIPFDHPRPLEDSESEESW
ncbi:GGDEF domain-containing protein [Frankia sp. CNm7]|uniref:GGDEF domain-containing protein n=2 Tax=Frankia nepalensis TaxID=1836974 RepID=A0A937RQJ9_9ACTN|nr:GGDEF domain-containing protein [Frankia nepalensis]MBL7494984.1 GGDEF domain-containing protein [Frankia nepalensis]MBL7514661.1 GGDEF domain-containing protein [Frankia nepalensis]MBL7523128.1 GGDEF domain-containing protein [Frankia nepalensis]MBL7633094.1 GGDEF domain-containing protein [Frankia nepalensis]